MSTISGVKMENIFIAPQDNPMVNKGEFADLLTQEKGQEECWKDTQSSTDNLFDEGFDPRTNIDDKKHWKVAIKPSFFRQRPAHNAKVARPSNVPIAHIARA